MNIDKDIYDVYINRYKQQGGEMIWGMKDGTEIMIKDMSMSHIKNCINMLTKKPTNGTRSSWVDIFNHFLIKTRILKTEKILY